MDPYTAGAGFALQAIGTGINMYRADKFMREAKNQLRDLENNPIEPYKASTQLRTAYAGARAGAAAPKGMSMEDVNRFMINQARAENTALANAGKMGYGGRGNLSILNAGLSGMSADMASKSAMMAQQNRQADLGRLQGLSSTYQNLSNMNANANMQAQAAYGRAIQQQRQNISNAWSGLANMGGMAAGYGLMSAGSPKAAAATTPAASGYTTAPSVETAVKGATTPGSNWLWDYSPDKNAPKSTSPAVTQYQMDPSQVSPAVTSDAAFNPALTSTGFATSTGANPYISPFPSPNRVNPFMTPMAPQPAFSFSDNSAGMSPQTVPGYAPQIAPGFMNYMNSQLTPPSGFRLNAFGMQSPVYGPMTVPYTTDSSTSFMTGPSFNYK
jgi:hypothetical protein